MLYAPSAAEKIHRLYFENDHDSLYNILKITALIAKKIDMCFLGHKKKILLLGGYMKDSKLMKAGLVLAVASFLFAGCEGESKKNEAKSYRLVKQEEYDATNKLSHYWVYTYDANNVLTTVSNYTGTNLDASTTYSYDPAGKRSKATSSTGSYTIYSYDENGFLTKMSNYSATKTLNSYTLVTTNSAGIWTRVDEYSGDSKFTGYKTFTLDASGRRTGSTKYSIAGVVLGNGTYSYNENNKIAKISFVDTSSSSSNYTRMFTYEEGSSNTDFMEFANFSKM
jgi:YD repeat-containing protein